MKNFLTFYGEDKRLLGQIRAVNHRHLDISKVSF